MSALLFSVLILTNLQVLSATLSFTQPSIVLMCLRFGAMCVTLDAKPSKGTPKGIPLAQMDDLAATQRHVILASLILESEQLFGFVPADEDEIEDHKNDSFSPWMNNFSDTDPLSLIHIAGDDNQQNKIRLCCITTSET
jgi:hypothetical protein